MVYLELKVEILFWSFIVLCGKKINSECMHIIKQKKLELNQSPRVTFNKR